MKLRRVLVLGLVLAGCSSAPPTAAPLANASLLPPAVSSAAPASPGESPTPAILTSQEMARAYLACANSFNKAEIALEKKYKGVLPLKSLRTFSAKRAALEGTFAKCIRAVAWNGSTLLSDIHILLTRTSTVQVTLLAESRAKTISDYEYLASIERKQGLAATSAANQVRGDLGLPPPPP